MDAREITDTSHLNTTVFFHEDPCIIPREINENVKKNKKQKTPYLTMLKKPFIWICTWS